MFALHSYFGRNIKKILPDVTLDALEVLQLATVGAVYACK